MKRGVSLSALKSQVTFYLRKIDPLIGWHSSESSLGASRLLGSPGKGANGMSGGRSRPLLATWGLGKERDKEAGDAARG
jgi:hypothetical protein